MADLNTLGGLHYEMIRRCYNEKSVAYKDYGAKGIKVCKEWHDRESFRKWCIDNGYKKGLRIERIDASKNYEPSNCRFGTTNVYKNKTNRENKELLKHRNNIKNICGVPKDYSKTRLYRIYQGMRSRCERASHTNYKNYGGRGIFVCEEWRGKYGFFYFYKWAIENGYTNKLSIDRIDSNKSYCPSNCRWSTDKEQQQNKRSSIALEYKGNIVNLGEIARNENVKYQLLYSRIKKGYSLIDALNELKRSTV